VLEAEGQRVPASATEAPAEAATPEAVTA